MPPENHNHSDDQDMEGPFSDNDSEHDPSLEKEFADFDAMLEAHLPGGPESHRGEVLEVPVVEIRDGRVFVSVGGKAEASIPIEEFPLVGEERSVKVGDIIPVVQTGRDGDTPRLSHRYARNRAAQKNIREAQEKKVPVHGRITQVVKGGVMVDIGLDAFMPASQVDLLKIPDLSTLIGQEIEAYVLEFDSRRNRAVLSRRELLFERRESTRKNYLKDLVPGSVVKGRVKSTLDFGVFVELGMVDGFIPREEVSWDRGKAPGDVLKTGDEVEVRILSIAEDTGKITLTRKRLADDPWKDLDKRYQVGSIVRGRIIAIQPYGAFVYVEEGVTGMIHATDMAWSSGNIKPNDHVKVGDEVTSQVLELNMEKKRLSLGLKQLTSDPWTQIERGFAVGTKHKGTISSLTNFGAFVKMENDVEGMVHVSDISWEKRIGHPKDHLKSGEEVEVIVLKLDSEARRIGLGIKQLKESPFQAYLREHPVGSVVRGKVTRFAPFGAFVELAEGLEGLIHVSQLDEKRVEVPENAVKQGEEVSVKILSFEAKNQKISLSRKEAVRTVEKENIRQYMAKKSDAPTGMTFGEALRAAKEKKDNE